MNPTAAPTTEDPQDKRLDGLDPALSQAERSIAICKLCNLKDEVWKCVYVVDKKQGKQPVWMCPCCGEQKNGGPDRIMAHYVKAAPGLALCEPKDFPGAMDKFVKNQEVCEKKWQFKKEKARVKKRDAAHLAALEATKKTRQIQTTLEDASQPVAWTQGACKEMFNSRDFEEWIKKQKYKKEGERLQAFVNNREWWDRLEAVHDAIEPVIALLRDTDGGKPIMGKFWFRMSSCIEAVREDNNLSETERAKVVHDSV